MEYDIDSDEEWEEVLSELSLVKVNPIFFLSWKSLN